MARAGSSDSNRVRSRWPGRCGSNSAAIAAKVSPLRPSDFLDENFGVELSEFQTTRLIEFFLKNLGAPVYNQAIHDARSFFQEKLDDLPGEFYEPEEPL